MKLETFFEKFDLFADAPNGVAKLRELVLHLAVQGKLVVQQPEDGDAAALLDAVARERSGLANVLRTPGEPQAVESDPPPFEIPPTWVWTRLGTLALQIQYGYTASADPRVTEVRMLRITDIQNNRVEWPSVPGCEIDEREAQKYLLAPNDILIARTGGTIGKSFIIPDAPVKSVFASYLIRVTPSHAMVARYLKIFLESPLYWTQLREASAGTGQPNVNGKALGRLACPLPPVAEQARIVAKVDELMALCDRLESQQQERETRRTTLAQAALARFADAPTPANLNFLFHDSFSIQPAHLRKSILALAVQGKLVRQEPRDEPARELLNRVERERLQIAERQGVRPPKGVPAQTGRSPHQIPKTWQWSRLGHLALLIDYGTSQKSDSEPTGVPVYRMGNIVDGRLVDSNLKYVNENIGDLPGLYLKTDDILFNRTNSLELVGKAGIFTGPDDTATFASYLIRVRLPSTLLCPKYFNLAMRAPYFWQTQIEPEVVQQCGQANFNGTKLAATLFPIPPLEEQRRIVARVEQLMALVERLEEHIASSTGAAGRLTETIVTELTARN
jgi:type I restriction enzyme S subunit